MGLQWADIGETLALTVPEMRAIRASFGEVLGISQDNRVSAGLVPVIALINGLRQRGMPDDDIIRQLRDSRVGEGWPEAVLARMQSAAAAALPNSPAPVGTPAGDGRGDYEPIETAEDAKGVDSEMRRATGGCLRKGERGSEDSESKIRQGTAHGEQTYGNAGLYLLKPQQSSPEITEATAREMVMDLRREICTHTVEERELLHRMNQLLQNLILEVRDLRYAFLLASSRKDRKRGKRGISRLLSG